MAIKFVPVRGKDAEIRKIPITNGNVYFAYDTGYIYLDKDDQRHTLGGSGTGGASFVWADAEEDVDLFKVSLDDDNPAYTMSVFAIEGSTQADPRYPQNDLLVINSDGHFFRVTGSDANHNLVLLDSIAVAGTGGGSATSGDLFLTLGNELYEGAVFLYGQSKNISMVATSTKDPTVKIFISAKDENTGAVYEFPGPGESYSAVSNKTFNFDTSLLPESSNLTITISITSSNTTMKQSQRPKRIIERVKVVKIGLNKFDEDAYLPLVKASDPRGELNIDFIPYGDGSFEETLHVYIDEEEYLAGRKAIPSTDLGVKNTIAIPRQSHGAHTISLAVSVNVNNETSYSDRINYEGAWASAGEETPIIWIGNYDPLVVNYETSYIKYMVYDPVQEANDSAAIIFLYKDNAKIMEIQSNYNATDWLSWDITNTYEVGSQVFSIACKNAMVDVTVDVTEVGARKLGLTETPYLMVNMTSAGRSNSEIKATREVWENSIPDENGIYKKATLTGFNWQNNGWRRDPVTSSGVDNGTYLSLTNGASVSIPVDSLYLNYDKNYSIELRFRVRNVQEYSTLVQALPLYFYENDVYNKVDEDASFDEGTTYYILRDGTESDPIYDPVVISEFDSEVTYYTRTGLGTKSESSALKTWIDEHNKQLIYDEYGSPIMDDNVVKSYKTEEGVICKWLNDNNEGFVIGSQETYFRSPRGIVNVRYKEDEVINLSCIISKDEGLVYIYLNGILSGADALPTQGGAFRITSPFEFNSNYCDIDLYRFRIYSTGLTMPNVIRNYLSDMHSTKLYDQNQLTQERTATSLDYDLLVDYNNNHPGELTMPYAVWTITNPSRAEKLPFFKGDKCKVDIEFVNPCLDEALENGEIDEWFYYTHSPSFKATSVDIDVQGTSSQGYPRRNYKTKYGKAKTWTYTKGSLAGLSLLEAQTVLDGNGVSHNLSKTFHMDNEKLGTSKFTWKIDYMESSGTYNTGFANLMGNPQYPLYTKHPLDDIQNGLGDGMRTTVYGYPVLTFHKYADGTNNPSNPGNVYEYIGRYNMNLDKSSNEYYGFESKAEQPFMTLTRDIEDPDTHEISQESYHPTIKSIAECWELEDNQGTWTSFKYPNAAARAARFGTTWPDNPNRLEVMRHFEYRYSPYADQLDAIGADGKYDGVTSDEAIIAEIGTTDAEKSEYVRDKYRNLEVLFDWIDSTDRSSATNNAITPVAWNTEIDYTNNGGASEPQYDYNPVPEGASFDSDAEYFVKNGNDYTPVEITEFVVGQTYYIFSIKYYQTTFTNDTPGYRLEKFRRELAKHLDKEYCLIYFIMTELLLCYDSRGKNMMMASWGPHEVGGDYIWYPIFYDIDTQLGLNNSGAYLWDYDADVTKDGLFSTPGSVLWNNFYDAFEEDIKNKYRALRGANDNSSVVNNLTYEKITGAYECDPEVFGSYAMKGIRPIIAIGLDEYYKYFATTKTGYFDTEGKTIIEDAPEYAYACQGDKKLTTELLLRNRLNYIDSWWSGGAYQINAVKQGQFWGRVNGNRRDQTSDKYLALTNEQIAAQVDAGNSKYSGFEHADYPEKYNDPSINYFDSRPGFKLKPFLKQYVSFFTDEVPGEPVKYNATDDEKDGIWTKVNSDTIETYRNEPESPNEQLVYIPGVDYLSSLGDLSTSYFSEFTLAAGKRLLDLTLGSDIPGYKNNLLKAGDGGKFSIADGLKSTTKKSLLKKIVFTGITSLQGTVDTQGSEKLEEFRALNTNLQNVYFADGAPLHTVHLPNTISTLQLIENADLTRILTVKPQVATLINGVVNYTNPADYRGLYLEDITDYTPQKRSTGHSLNSLIIEGNGLGYGSYKILENLINLKQGASTNKNLAISLKDVKWSPYNKVEEGSLYEANVDYYYLTDHNTFIPFKHTSPADWSNKILNEKIYIYNPEYNKDPENGEVQEQTITSLEMLDNFITWKEAALAAGVETQFSNTKEATSVPAITGELYVANTEDNKIAESDLTSKYGKAWPNLSIYAAHVAESYIAKFVQINESGKEEELQVDKLSPFEYSRPLIPNGLIPDQPYHDFVGWTLDKEYTKVAIEYDNTNEVYVSHLDDYEEETTFNAETNSVITFYAKFIPHSYKMSFDSDDGNEPVVLLQPWVNAPGINEPNFVPYKPYDYTDDEMTPSGELGLYRTYKFLGWALIADPTTVVNLAGLRPDRNRSFIAVYEDVNVHQNVIDLKYLSYGEIGNGYYVGINPEYILSGKITLPVRINGKPVLQLGSGVANFQGAKGKNITHIFWGGSEEERALTTIYGACFQYPSQEPSSLVYLEPVPTCTTIGTTAFNYCPNLRTSNVTEILDYAQNVYGTSFSRSVTGAITVPGHTFVTLANQAFGGWIYATELTLGSQEQPCEWCSMIGTVITTNSQLFNGFGNSAGSTDYIKINIYLPSADNTEEKKTSLLQALGFGGLIDKVWTTNTPSSQYNWQIV